MKLELRTLPLVLLFTIVGASSPLIAQTRDDTTVYNEELQIVHFEDFDYPAEARRTGVEGVVVIGATLNAQGQIIDATVVSGPRLLVPETLANARKWRFAPNRLKRAVIVYRFTLADACAPDTLQSFFTWNGPGPNVASISACRMAP
jgi:TonB family protein